MTWQTGWRTVLPGKHVFAGAMSEKANNKEREKREEKENSCEVHGGPNIK